MPEHFLGRPTVRCGAMRGVSVGDPGETGRRHFENVREAVGGFQNLVHDYFNTTLAKPELLALSATRSTSRCSPAERPVKSSANRSRIESITPSTDCTGTQLAASREYSQWRRGDAASTASNSTCAVPLTIRTG